MVLLVNKDTIMYKLTLILLICILFVGCNGKDPLLLQSSQQHTPPTTWVMGYCRGLDIEMPTGDCIICHNILEAPRAR